LFNADVLEEDKVQLGNDLELGKVRLLLLFL